MRYHLAMSVYRLALISDIHGNEVALRAVLEDIRRFGVDQIACLGDVATLGPRPREVLALVREACEFFILGNHDEYMFEPDIIRAHTNAPAVISAVEQCRNQLRAEEIAVLRGFSARLELPLPAGNNLLIFHGSPDSNNCDLLAETPETELDSLLGGQDAKVMAGGHTHVQMLRQHRGRWLVNPGSVGLPFERFVAGAPPTILPHAEYAIVECRAGASAVALQRVELDRDALIKDVGTWTAELASYLLEQYRR
jgi:predicted phosphodiesterase